MSNIHAYPNAFDRMAPASGRTPTDAIVSLRVFGNGLATSLFSGFQHRWTMKRIARFSDHRLKDMGFERDWDGSIIPKHGLGGGAARSDD